MVRGWVRGGGLGAGVEGGAAAALPRWREASAGAVLSPNPRCPSRPQPRTPRPPVGDVAVAQHRRLHQRVVADAHAVVHLVALAQAAQDGDRLRHRGLVDEDLLEAALERGVLLNVLAVLVELRVTGRVTRVTRATRAGCVRSGVPRAGRSLWRPLCGPRRRAAQPGRPGPQALASPPPPCRARPPPPPWSRQCSAARRGRALA
jgi:hypothetical protein